MLAGSGRCLPIDGMPRSGRGGGRWHRRRDRWHLVGILVCVDRKAAPACNDEQVVFEISGSAGKPKTVTVKADKVVDGKRVSMGVLEFTHDAKSGSWTSEFETPRVHDLWRLTVNRAMLTGTLTSIPSRAIVRKIDLRKDK